jgi:hypothetical protein
VKSPGVDVDTSASKLRQWMPTFQVVVLSFLLKGWWCPTRLSVCCSTRNDSDGLVGIVFFRAVFELNSEEGD